jgi:hypothetical protein
LNLNSWGSNKYFINLINNEWNTNINFFKILR